MLGLSRRPKWSLPARTAADVGKGLGTDAAVVAVCGDQLDAMLRSAVAGAVDVADAAGPDAGMATELVVIEALCAHPERLRSFCQAQHPAAVVAVACDLHSACSAVEEEVADGFDLAHIVAMSLAPALESEEASERAMAVTATCRAASLRARMLARQPPAGRMPWQAGQSLGRRGLLGAWHGQPSHSALIDTDACLGADRCGRCLSDCPVGAIGLEGSAVHVDPRACVSCGLCVTTCPTRAISMPGADLDGIVAAIESLTEGGVNEITAACERCALPDRPSSREVHIAPQALFSLPCVATVTPGMMIALSATGTTLHVETCADCHCYETVEAIFRFGERLTSTLGVPNLLRGVMTSRSDRREGDQDQRGAVPAAVVGVTDRHKEAPQMLGLTWHEPEATNAAVALLGDAKMPPRHDTSILDGGAPTRVVTVDAARCTMCGSCALACPRKALVLDRSDQVLRVDSSQCVACGQCVTVCPEEAVAVDRGIDMCAVLGGPQPVKALGSSRACPACGATVEIDVLVASVQRRLAIRGKPSALISSLQRCRACSGAMSKK